MSRIYHIVLLGVLLTGLVATVSQGPVAHAQEAWASLRVTYVAGQNVYLDAGRAQHFMRGDTLTLYRDGVLAGRLVVVSSISDRSVTTFVGEPFSVVQGGRFQVRLAGLADEVVPPAQPLEAAPAPPVALPVGRIAYRPAHARPRTPRRAGPRVDGRVQVSLNAFQSHTTWSEATSGTTKRTFVTPSLSAQLTLHDLPQGLRLRTRFRTDYRYSASRSIEPMWSIRAYEVVLERQFTGFLMQAGRFANRYTPYSGYWDGVLLHVGGQHVGFGTALGFMPDRSNEGFSSEMPRYSGFAHVNFGDRSRLRYAATLSFNEIRPANPLSAHRFAGLSHRVQGRGFALRHDLQLDRDPMTDRWIASRLQVRGAIAPMHGVRIHGRYAIRQPYSIYRVGRVLSYRRDQATAGLSLQISGAVLGADVAFNFIEDEIEGRLDDGRTVSGYLQLPRTGLLALGFAATASYWQDDHGSSLFLNTGVSRRLGRTQVRLQYQFYRTETLSDPLVTHAATVRATIPLGRALYTSWQVRLQQSTHLRSMACYTSLWYHF